LSPHKLDNALFIGCAPIVPEIDDVRAAKPTVAAVPIAANKADSVGLPPAVSFSARRVLQFDSVASHFPYRFSIKEKKENIENKRIRTLGVVGGTQGVHGRHVGSTDGTPGAHGRHAVIFHFSPAELASAYRRRATIP
jgi:hypothetical protein